nr:MAG TPA: hypothetical protein [Caudoviricetes sp.]
MDWKEKGNKEIKRPAFSGLCFYYYYLGLVS